MQLEGLFCWQEPAKSVVLNFNWYLLGDLEKANKIVSGELA